MLKQHLLSSCCLPSPVRAVGKYKTKYLLSEISQRCLHSKAKNELFHSYSPRAPSGPGGGEETVPNQTYATVWASETQT